MANYLQEYADAVGITTVPVEEPEVPVAEIVTEAPPADNTVVEPQEIDIDSLFKDPKAGPKLQSALDRRVSGQMKKVEQQVEQRFRQQQEAKLREEADKRFQEDYEQTVRVASSSDDFDESVQAARKKLSTMASTQSMRKQWEEEMAPRLQNSIEQRYQTNLADQYDNGLSEIPELQSDEALHQALHWSNYDHAGNWVKSLVDVVSEQRVNKALADQELKLTKGGQDRIEAGIAQGLAEHRATMPDPDLSVSPPKNENTGLVVKGLSEYSSRAEIEASIDQLLKIYSPRQIRAIMQRLPERV